MNFIIDLVIYPYDIMFSIDETNKQFKNSCKKRLPKEYYTDLKDDPIMQMGASLRGRTFHHLIGGQTIIRLPNKPNTSEEMGTLTHEIFHAVDYIFRRINITLNVNSDEAYAYLIGYITEQFYSKVK